MDIRIPPKLWEPDSIPIVDSNFSCPFLGAKLERKKGNRGQASGNYPISIEINIRLSVGVNANKQRVVRNGGSTFERGVLRGGVLGVVRVRICMTGVGWSS